jgi:hypothetical protein
MPDEEIVSGQRVVLGRRDRMSMVKFKWSGKEPQGLDRPEEALELGAQWEGDELVVYDYPGFEALLEYYERGEYLADND